MCRVKMIMIRVLLINQQPPRTKRTYILFPYTKLFRSKGLTSYGDNGFSLFLRKAFIKGAGYTDSALDRPVIGIANTGSAYNPCHGRSEEHTSELQSLMRISYAVFCLKKKIELHNNTTDNSKATIT